MSTEQNTPSPVAGLPTPEGNHAEVKAHWLASIPDGLSPSGRDQVATQIATMQLALAAARAEVERLNKALNGEEERHGIAISQIATAKEERAKLESDNLAEWSTLMADIHDYYKEERCDRGHGRVRLVLTLLGQLRYERAEARSDLAKANAAVEEHREAANKWKEYYRAAYGHPWESRNRNYQGL